MSTAQFAGMTAEQASTFQAAHHEQKVRRRVAEIVGRGRVLDLGCGAGDQVSQYFTPDQYLGVDCSGELIMLARERNPGYLFTVGDGRLVAYRVGWDYCILKSVLEHLPLDEALVLYERARSLCQTLLVVWHTEPKGRADYRKYQGELGTMLQNRHDRLLFAGVQKREVCDKHVIWTVC